MKISIDTKEDSHEEIRKVVKMLHAWLESHSSDSGGSPHSNIFDSGSPGLGESSESSQQDSSQGGLFNLFNDSSSESSASQPSSGAHEVEDVLDLDKKEGSDPKIITY